MNGQALLVTFDAKEFPSGRITAQHPGMAVRVHGADEILEDGLDLHYEIVGGSDEARQAFLADLQDTFSAEVKITQDRPDVMRFLAVLHDWQRLESHPVMALELRERFTIDRLSTVYEEGLCIMRIEFPNGTRLQDMEAWRDRMAAACEEAGLDASVRIGPLDRSMEDWEPLP